VPPADGCAGGVAGAGACANVAELIAAKLTTAMPQAANVIATIERIIKLLQLKSVFIALGEVDSVVM
jgi:hypothetical protein